MLNRKKGRGSSMISTGIVGTPFQSYSPKSANKIFVNTSAFAGPPISLIREMGGPAKADVFTKILLALFGEYDWNGVPTMPVEIMLLPRPFFLFNIYEISYWSRTVLVPLLVLLDRKPVKWLPPHLSLDELWPVPREETRLRFSRVPEPFSWRGLFWKSFFIAVDDGLKIWERFSPRPLRRRAIETAPLWLEERRAVPGGWGGCCPG